MQTNVDRYWKQYLNSLPGGIPHQSAYADSFYFGTNRQDAHQISKLVLSGTKTATGSVKWSFEADEKPEPRAGDLSVITNGGDDPVCIIETTEVRIIPFDEVEEDYAVDGGERDRTLDSWRAMYWDHIISECARIGRSPSKKTPLIMERFRVVYSEVLADN